MKQRYKEAYGAYRAYVSYGSRVDQIGLIRLMDEFGAEAVHAAMKSFHLRYVSDSYNLPFLWRYDDIPF